MFEDKDVYLIGIGGCGMSGLARMVAGKRSNVTGERGPSASAGSAGEAGTANTGARVTGSDSMVTPVTRALEAEGIRVDQDDAPLPDSVAGGNGVGNGVVIASAAIKPDHPQLIEAHERGLEVLTYAQALGRCMADRTGVALAGTHGKSTTTAMLGTVLVDAGLDPSVIVGALCGQLANGAMGGGEEGTRHLALGTREEKKGTRHLALGTREEGEEEGGEGIGQQGKWGGDQVRRISEPTVGRPINTNASHAMIAKRVKSEKGNARSTGKEQDTTAPASPAFPSAQCLVPGASPPFPQGHAPTGFRLGASEIPHGAMIGKPGLLLVEACEYNRSFHDLRPTIASISAVEADHLDVYGSLDAVVEAFAAFARLVPDERDGGRLLIAHEGANRREITAGVTCAVETIGFSPSADWSVIYEPETRRVTLSHERKVVAHWQMRLPGEHNAMNAATACALAIMLGAEPDVAAASLGLFKGVQRRTEFLGLRAVDGDSTSAGTVRVWDDYGHHPTEIDKTLRALREFEEPQRDGGRLICVFQPHQHSRTRFLLDEFAASFEHADIVIVPDIYFVRDTEAEKHKVSSADLVDRLRSRGVRAMHVYPFGAIVEQLESLCRRGDVVVSMGAGPVWEVTHAFLASGAMGASVKSGESGGAGMNGAGMNGAVATIETASEMERARLAAHAR